MDMTMNDKPKSKTRKMIVALVVGGVAGFFTAMGFMQLVKTGALGEFSASQEIAGLVGIIYVLTAISVGVGLVSPSLGARFLNVEDADELREQHRMLTWSAVGMVALGAALVIAAIGTPGGPLSATAVVLTVAALVALAWFAGVRQRRHTDELMASVSIAATSTAFYLMFLIGGSWSLLAHVNLVAAPMPLDWLTMFAALMLVSCFIVAGKRGMLKQR